MNKLVKGLLGFGNVIWIWMETMSGGFSVVFTVAGLWVKDKDEKTQFFILAFGCLWVVVVSLSVKHSRQRKTLQMEIDRLNGEIKFLNDTKQAENERAAQRRRVREELAFQLVLLEGRIAKIAGMSELTYKNSIDPDGDNESAELLNNITGILTKNMDVATAVLFSSRIGVEYTPVHGVGTFGHEERVKQMAVLNHLTHNATQLKEIIRNYK